jgi:hypothetical protein
MAFNSSDLVLAFGPGDGSGTQVSMWTYTAPEADLFDDDEYFAGSDIVAGDLIFIRQENSTIDGQIGFMRVCVNDFPGIMIRPLSSERRATPPVGGE